MQTLTPTSEPETLRRAWLMLACFVIVAWTAFGLVASGKDLSALLMGGAVLAVIALEYRFVLAVRQDAILTEHLRWRFGRFWSAGPLVVIDFLLFTYWRWYRVNTRYRSDPERTS
jgi:hypothetical protein